MIPGNLFIQGANFGVNSRDKRLLFESLWRFFLTLFLERGNYLIRIENLVKVYENGFKAVDDVSLNIQKKEIFGIIGLSGAGKSSLIRCINRLEEATSGKIFVEDKCINDFSEKELREYRKDVSMIFQSFNLFYQKNVFDNIAFPLKVNGWKKADIKERVLKLLKYVNLEDKIYSYPSNLSGGQKQRVAIARALATDPKILLYDEATSALDPKSTKSILELLQKIRNELDLTIVLITHQMEVVKDICDRAAVMDSGKIVEEDMVLELFTSPKSNITRSLIENIPVDVESYEVNRQKYSGIVLRLGFTKELSTMPILSSLIKETGVDISVISGNIDTVKDGKVGHLIIEVVKREDFPIVKSFLEGKRIIVEEVL